MKFLRANRLAVPPDRIPFFDAVFGLARTSGAIDEDANPDDEIWRTYRKGKSHRIRRLAVDKRRYRLTSKVHKSEDDLSSFKTKAVFETARKLIGLIMRGEIQGRIDLQNQRALVLNTSYAHLLYSQLYTVLGTGYLRVVRNGKSAYGLVSFDLDAIEKVFKTERKSGQSLAVSQADKKLIVELATIMKEYAKKEYAEIYDRLSFSMQVWQFFKQEVEQWMNSRRGEPRKIVDAHYRTYVGEAMYAADLTSKAGNKTAEAKATVRKVFEHFVGKARPEIPPEDSVIEN